MSLTIATEAPSFDLPGVDGRNHSLDDYADAPILAVVWSCNHCPYVIAWEGHEGASGGVRRPLRSVAINSNDAENYPADSFDAMKQRARGAGVQLRLPPRRRPVGRAGVRPGAHARGLPLRPQPPLVYHGAIDDSREEDGVTERYVRDAIEALLADQDPPVSETPPVGCSVK